MNALSVQIYLSNVLFKMNFSNIPSNIECHFKSTSKCGQCINTNTKYLDTKAKKMFNLN